MKSKLLKAAGVMAGLTLISRVLGMIRDVASAKSYGTSWQWDAFIYAFMLPNFMRRLVGEGALSSAFIPVYAEMMEREGKEAASRFANVVLSLLSGGLFVFIGIVEILILLLLSWSGLPPVIRLTCELLQVFFPYLFFIALCALAMGILNCHGHFFSPALSPIILDLVWIAGVLWVSSWKTVEVERQVFFLALFVLVSGAIQLGVQIPSLRRHGFSPQVIFDWAHPGLWRVGKLILPAVLGFAVVQINILVDMSLGFWVGAGANSSLWYGNRLMQFPLGVFAIAMGTAVLPTVSHQTARQEIDEVKKTLSFALRTIFLIIFPATVGLIVLRTPIVKLLFERGAFDSVSTARTSFVVLGYTLGLFAYSGQKIIATGFYSLQDTQTPVKVGVITLLMNIVLNLILMGPLREAGLALATSISGIFNFVALVYLYNRKISGFPIRELLISSTKILLASLVMGGFSWYFFEWINQGVGGGPTVRLLLAIFGSMSASALIYVGFCFLLRVPEIQELWRWIRSPKPEKELEKMGEAPL